MGDTKKRANLGEKPPIEVKVPLDLTDPENPKVLTEAEAEKVEKPEENLFWIVSKWKKPNYNLSRIIELNQYVDKVINGQIQRMYDSGALMTARIRVLLSEWNLQELDEKFKLEFDRSSDDINIKILTLKCMSAIGSIEPAGVVYSLYNGFLSKMYPELYGDTALKNLTSEESKKD